MGGVVQGVDANLTDSGKYFITTAGIVDEFETMVFPVKDGVIDFAEIETKKYSTWDEAEAGHLKLFRKWNKK
jgi:hypothetical protein